MAKPRKPRRSSTQVIIDRLARMPFDQVEAFAAEMESRKPGLANLVRFHLNRPDDERAQEHLRQTMDLELDRIVRAGQARSRRPVVGDTPDTSPMQPIGLPSSMKVYTTPEAREQYVDALERGAVHNRREIAEARKLGKAFSEDPLPGLDPDFEVKEPIAVSEL